MIWEQGFIVFANEYKTCPVAFMKVNMDKNWTQRRNESFQTTTEIVNMAISCKSVS